ncbi:hypothetical protein [Nocardia sp. NPDC051570]|uniref:hypothetical protein n=1 Tax=Nocardia sp. NPDC051570 TaxID=3364324 RepID=UPI0037B8E793
MEPVSILAHLDSDCANFRDYDPERCFDHGYRWADTKRFWLASDAPDDRKVLAALIAHPQFLDTYDGGASMTGRDMANGGAPA